MSKKVKPTPRNSSIADIFGCGQWLITADGQAQLEAATNLLAAAQPQTLSATTQQTDLHGVVNVIGPLARYDNWVSGYLGWSTIEGIQRQVKELDANADVKEITMNFDTPGGVVHGLPECATAIAECETPIKAYTSGVCASAGYWLASQCDAMYSSILGIVGNIGAKSYFYEPEKEVVTSRHAPKKSGTRAGTQRLVDDVEAVFIDTVAAGRGVTREHVIANYGGGDVFVGQSAVDAGLVDGIATFDQILAGDIGMPPVLDTNHETSAIGESMKTDTTTTGGKATGKTTAAAPAEPAAAQATASAAPELTAEQAATAAVKAERERSSAITKAGAGKDQTMVQAYIDDGVSAEQATAWLAMMPEVKPGGGLAAQMAGTNPEITNGEQTNSDGSDDEDAKATAEYVAGAESAMKEIV